MHFLVISMIGLLVALRQPSVQRAIASIYNSRRYWVPLRRAQDQPKLKPGHRKDHEIDQFTYYPGIASGYAGYTDYNAMRSDLNNWLLKVSDEEQFWLVGFGAGFSQGVIDGCKVEEPEDHIRHIPIPDMDVSARAAIGWLGKLQASGTDNSGPSTLNLHEALRQMRDHLAEKGPVRMDYWKKALSGTNEPVLPADATLIAARARQLKDAESMGRSVANNLVALDARSSAPSN